MVEGQQSRLITLIALLVTLLFSSCREKSDNSESINSIIDGSGKYTYCYTSLVDSSYCDLALSLNLSRDFRYDRFNFELRVSEDDLFVVIDTLSLPIKVDFVGTKRITTTILSDLRLKGDDYTFQLRGLMPTDCVGIDDIKLRIVPKK